MVTGEPMPVTKTAGPTVIGATINQTGTFEYKGTKIGADTMLAQIIKLVRQAKGSKAPIQRPSDRVSAYFVRAAIAVMAVAIWAFVIWALVRPPPAFITAPAGGRGPHPRRGVLPSKHPDTAGEERDGERRNPPP